MSGRSDENQNNFNPIWELNSALPRYSLEVLPFGPTFSVAYIHYVHANSDVLAAVQAKIQVFWDIIPCRLVNRQLPTSWHFTLGSCIIAMLITNSCEINCYLWILWKALLVTQLTTLLWDLLNRCNEEWHNRLQWWWWSEWSTIPFFRFNWRFNALSCNFFALPNKVTLKEWRKVCFIIFQAEEKAN